MEVIYNSEQFFIIILFAIWFFIVSEGIEAKASILLYIQFILLIPLMIWSSANAYIQSIPLGYIFTFTLLLIGSGIIAYGWHIQLSDNEKRRNK